MFVNQRVLGFLVLLCVTAGLWADESIAVTPSIQTGAESNHLMLLKSDGTLWAWGSNQCSELGLGDTASRWVPRQIKALHHVIAMAAGEAHSVALKADGTVWTWGCNYYGQLGTGDLDRRSIPVQVPNLTHIVSVAAASGYTLAVDSTGHVWSWGINDSGQLGDDAPTNRNQPRQLSSIERVISVAAGYKHVLALTTDGSVWSWGNGDALGQGDVTAPITPHRIDSLQEIKSIAAGQYHSLAVRADGGLWAWGLGTNGSLCLGQPAGNRKFPSLVKDVNNIVAAAAGTDHSLLLQKDGRLLACGGNNFGQLGLGDRVNRYSPVVISALDNVVALTTGYWDSFALRSDGSGWSFGANFRGTLGLGDKEVRLLPAQIDASHHVATTLSPAIVDFGDVPRGSTSAYSTIDFSVNSGAMTLDFNPDHFARSGLLRMLKYKAGSCGSSSATLRQDSDGSCNFSLSDNAAASWGLRRSLLTIPNDSTLVKAIIIAAQAKLNGGVLWLDSFTDMDFGAQLPLSQTDKTYTFINRGNANVNISSVSLNGEGFFIQADNCSSMTLNPHKSCAVTVRFSPANTGPLTADLSAHSNDPVNPVLSTQLKGGYGPLLQVNPGTVDFGTAELGSIQTAHVIVSNAGNAVLTVTSLSLVSSQISILNDHCSGMSVAASNHCDFDIQYLASLGGAQFAKLGIVSDDDERATIVVDVSAIGNAPQLQVPYLLSFGGVVIGQYADRDLQLGNLGNQPLSLYKKTVSKLPFSLIADNCPAVLLPAATCQVTLRYTPTQRGPRSTSLIVDSNDPNVPAKSIVLSGWTKSAKQ